MKFLGKVFVLSWCLCGGLLAKVGVEGIDKYSVIEIKTEFETHYKVAPESECKDLKEEEKETLKTRLATWKIEDKKLSERNSRFKMRYKNVDPKPYMKFKIVKKFIDPNEAKTKREELEKRSLECALIMVTTTQDGDSEIYRRIEVVLKRNLTARIKQIRIENENTKEDYSGESRPISPLSYDKAKALSTVTADLEKANKILSLCGRALKKKNEKAIHNITLPTNPYVKSAHYYGSIGATSLTGAFGDAIKKTKKEAP